MRRRIHEEVSTLDLDTALNMSYEEEDT